MKLCDVCGSAKTFITTKLELASWPVALMCGDCGANVACHPGTELPVGLMGNAVTRYWRKVAHLAFDKIWKSRCMTREKAYRWMSEQLNVQRFHISQATDIQLIACIKISEDYCKRKGPHKLAQIKKQSYAKERRLHERKSKHDYRYAKKRRQHR